MVEFASGFRKSGGCPSVDFAPAGRARGGDRVNLSRLGSFRVGLLPQRGKSAALAVATAKRRVWVG